MGHGRRWGVEVATVLLAVAFALILLPLPALALGAQPVGSPEAASIAAGPRPSISGSFVHPPGLGRPNTPSVSGAAYGQVWYTQEGATLAQFNGSTTQTGVKALEVDIPLVSSPYPIGYELNGLTNRGDWYQVVIGDNWPNCPGYEMITEVWDNAQGSGPVGCDSTVSMSTGDLIRLGLNFTSSSAICMDLTDVTRSRSHSICQAQPNAGGTQFSTLSTVSDTNGYFTGPMTEIANVTASSCPDYTHMPLVNYEWAAIFGVSAYLPWSDEFELTTGTACYSGNGGFRSFAAGDPSTDYLDTASGTSYGPHYVAGQLYGLVNPSYGFRIQTDPVPLTGVTLAASALTIPLQANVTLTATVTGGVSPYPALWALNGTLFANGTLQRNFTGAASGTYRFQAYGVDKFRDVVGPSTVAAVVVNGPLSLSGVRVSLASGSADVGQSVTFSVVASGGLPPYSYLWVGLPVECPPGNSPTVPCVPAAPAVFSIHVQVTDANATVLDSGTRTFTVFPAPAATVGASATLLDVGMSAAFVAQVTGGSGNLSYAWAGLPPPCAPVNRAQINCAVSTPGLFPVAVVATDSNGVAAPTNALAVQVFMLPSVTLLVDRPVTDAGVAITFSATPVGGSGGFGVVWIGLPPGCGGGNHLLLQCVPSAGGTYSVQASVTDSAGGTALSDPVVVLAYSALNLTVLGPASVAVGETLSASVNASGGAPGVTYRWAGLPPGCSPPMSPQLSCQPSLGGEYNITVTASDTGGGFSTVTYHLIVLYPPPTGSSPPGGLPLLVWAGIAVLGIALIAGYLVLRRRRI